MKDELTDRQLAITLRLAGHSVDQICRTLHRSRDWFHRWWRRYTCPTSRASAGRAMGPGGLLEMTRAHVPTQQCSPELERSILTIRRRLEATAHPGTRYRFASSGPAPF